MAHFLTFRGHKLLRIEQFRIFRGKNFHGLDWNPRKFLSAKVCTFKVSFVESKENIFFVALDSVLCTFVPFTKKFRITPRHHIHLRTHDCIHHICSLKSFSFFLIIILQFEWNLTYLTHSRNDRSNIVPTLGFEPRTSYTQGGFSV